MAYTIPSAALGLLPESERNRLLDAALSPSPQVTQDYILILDARLRAFEIRYEIASSQLHSVLASNQLPETAEVSRWLFWIQLRDFLAREARP